VKFITDMRHLAFELELLVSVPMRAWPGAPAALVRVGKLTLPTQLVNRGVAI
jgi:hypothetical protein